MKTKDVHSFAQPEEAVVKHLSLDIKVDFETRTISGKAAWQIANITKTDKIFFDTNDLAVERVTVGKEEKTAHFYLDSAVEHLGRALVIDIEPSTDYLTIYYKTSPSAAALQWLTPQQTAEKKFPFLFTQSQAILARTWIPCQDGPGVRFTYDARVEVPKELLAVMSAKNPSTKNADGLYTFSQDKPIPSYLMALSVGDLVFKPIDERTGVYAEPVTIDKAHYEFADMGKMVDAAENLYGEYAWGRYDVIVLPPSFPFGGMENPMLTFATPTIIAGDRSLTSLVAHELAHSWSGNLVTNATWNDMWLNEGFTVYFERRIMEELYGESYAEMLTYLGSRDLRKTVAEFGDTNVDTKLKLNLQGRNPDDAVSDIAYEKGFFFLKMLENYIGRERFDSFLNNYFSSHAFTSMDTEGFLPYMKKELLSNDEKTYNELLVEQWVYGTGLPSNFPAVNSGRFSKVDESIQNFMSGVPAKELPSKEWTTHEWLHFIAQIPDSISLEKMKELDEAFNFTHTGNSEVLDAWLLLSIKRNYATANPALENFLVNVGRRKFLTPLYKAMLKTEEGKRRAKDIYTKARPNYHFVATTTIDALMAGN